jgi:phage terminase small subunit
MTLTQKQERFAQEVASGKSLTDAYKASFKVKPTAKPQSINQMASRLMSQINISSRIAEMQAEAAERVLWSMEDSLNVLSAIAKGQDEDAKPSDKVNAVKAINAMIGLDAPSKLNVNGDMVHRVVREVIDGADADD